MQKVIIYILIGILGLCGYTIYNLNNEIYNIRLTTSKPKVESCGAPEQKEKITSKTNTGKYISGNFTDGSQLLGKPSLIVWAGYFCKYCRDKVPKIEDMIYKPYSGSINIQINVMNFESQKFDTLVPQAPYESITYASYMGEECNAFPTWIFTDARGKVIVNECGGTGNIEDLAKIIKNNL